jgi:hypothetical protein
MRIFSVILVCLVVLTPLVSALLQKVLETIDKKLIRGGVPNILARFDDQEVVSLSFPGEGKIPQQAFKHIEDLNLDVLEITADSLHILVGPKEKAKLSRIPGAILTTVVKNLQALIDAERINLSKASAENATWFNSYHTLDEIYNWFHQLARNYSDIVSEPVSIGTTIENRPILQLRITAPGDASNRKRIWLQGLMHAREWISGTTVQYIAYSLAQDYANGNARVRALLNDVVFVIVPVVNPDGYVYTWTSNRLWRKNREPTVKGFAYGVDLNRNWPSHWGGDGSSSIPISESYRGPYAASSREVQALRAAFVNEPNVIGAIDLHSYAQLILRPYGWTTSPAPDEAALSSVGEQFARDIKATTGETYASKRSIELYAMAGGVTDWWYSMAPQEKARAGIPGPRPYAYCIELRPAKAFSFLGFILPTSEIIPTGQEIYAGLLHFSETIYANPLPN